MARGAVAEVGTERVSKNGYCYIKTEDRGWVLKHWLIWEKANGRIINSEVEQVRFIDGNKTNFDPRNIIVIPKGKVQLRAKIARLEAAVAEYTAQLAYYRRELAKEENKS